jgi:perosamine synthetase
MKKLISHNLAPNNTIADVWQIIASWWRPLSWQKKQLTKVKEIFSQHVQTHPSQLFLLDSARSAITIGLVSLEQKDIPEILVHPISCTVVLNSIIQAGWKPVVVDIESTTYNMDIKHAEKMLSSKTKAVLVQHTYGSAADMEAIVGWCKRNNLLLVEDCAWALGLEYDYQGSKYSAGSLGDISVYSFGREKQISTTCGGALRINNKDYLEKAKNLVSQLKPMSTQKQAQAAWYAMVVVCLVRPLYYVAQIGKIVWALSEKCKFVFPPITADEKKLEGIGHTPSLYGERLSGWLVWQLNKFESAQEHRKSITEIYQTILGIPNISKNNCMFLIDVSKVLQDPIKRKAVVDRLKHTLRHRHQVFMWDGNQPFIPLAKQDLFKKGIDMEKYPNANRLSDSSLIALPTHINVTTEDARRIASVVKELLNL